MAEIIICPNCKEEIEISEAIALQLREQIRKEYEGEYKNKLQKIEAERQKIEKQEKELASLKDDIDKQIEQRLRAERENLLKQAKAQAKEDLSLELKDREERVKELQKQLRVAQKAELELRKKERELQEKAERLELKVERKLAKEREKILQEASKTIEQEYKLKEAEKEQKIKDLLKQIEEMKRKAEQGSQQSQGEILELELENTLMNAFPNDIVKPVPKGISGADVMQLVKANNGLDCGIILWESKRTKNWSDKWLGKLRNDQRQAKASLAVIVTATLPKGVNNFANIDGVWVCHWSCVLEVANVLRMALLETAKIRLAIEGQQEKTELVYNYLTGVEFRNRVTGILEPIIMMKDDFEKEKRAIQKQWAKREQQIERALHSLASMYGDFQGIIGGGTLPELKGISLPQLEAPKG